MAIPDFQSFFLPLLQFCADGKPHSVQEAYGAMTAHFRMSADDLQEMLPSGKQTTFNNRVAWAKVYLAKALLLESPKRGLFQITARGRELMNTKPARLRVPQLKQYQEFLDFHAPGKEKETDKDEERSATPEEIFESAYKELSSRLAGELLTQVATNTPKFFEDLVIKLLVKMGYGGSIKDAGQAIGRSGDEGIDGIIKEDKLGLDVIYIQAKRWQGAVGRP